MGRGMNLEVWVGSREPFKGPGRVEGHSWSSWTSQGTLPEDQDGSGDTPNGPGWVGRSSEKFGKGQDVPGRSGTGRGSFRRFGTGRGTLPKVQDGSRDPP